MRLFWTYYISYSFWYYLFHPHKFIWDAYREIKAFIERGMYGCARCDVWSFDSYTALVILRGLKLLINTPVGLPYDREKKKDLERPECFAKFKKVIAEMIKGFDIIVQSDYYCTHDITEKDQKVIDRALHLFALYHSALWW